MMRSSWLAIFGCTDLVNCPRGPDHLDLSACPDLSECTYRLDCLEISQCLYELVRTVSPDPPELPYVRVYPAVQWNSVARVHPTGCIYQSGFIQTSGTTWLSEATLFNWLFSCCKVSRNCLIRAFLITRRLLWVGCPSSRWTLRIPTSRSQMRDSRNPSSHECPAYQTFIWRWLLSQ